jgi:dipeptidyl aminopeptidase/acylaminoacyl peptidase
MSQQATLSARLTFRSCRTPLALLALATLVGCGGPSLRIMAEPADARITAKQGGRVLVEGKPSPASVSATFDNGPISLEVLPGPSISERYVAVTRTVDASQFASLPVVSGETRSLTVKLDERDFVNVVFVDVVIDPENGLVGLASRARAMKSTAEEGGRPPSKIVDLDSGLGLRGVAISPDGNRMVFSLATLRNAGQIRLDDSFIASPDATKALSLQKSNLRAINLAGGGVEQLTTDSFIDSDPAFTSDGKGILMASNRRRANSADILRISSLARGGGIQDIYTDRTRGGRVANISQGASGLTAFCLYPQGGDPQIWTIGGESGFPTELGQGVNPAISPDGNRIAFVRDGDIYVMNSDGTGATQLTFDAGQILRRTDEFLTKNGDSIERALWTSQRKYFQANSSPAWSPDGRAIAFTSSRSVDSDGRPNEDIYVVNLDGGEPRQLTTNRSTDRTPVFSPDGQSLYFVSNRGGNWAIWRTPVADR